MTDAWRRLGCLCAFLAALAAAPLAAQQPNVSGATLTVQFRFGPPYPIIATAPYGTHEYLNLVGGSAMPFVLWTGPISPGAYLTSGLQSVDLGPAPNSVLPVFVLDGFNPGPTQSLAQLGAGSVGSFFHALPLPGGTVLALDPLQALVLDPGNPVDGFSLSAATQVTLTAPRSILFIQGDYVPIPGYGPHCRLADTSLIGFSGLRALLLSAGFSSVDEVVDSTFTLTPDTLSPYGVVVLGSNRRVFGTAEALALEQFVLAGGGVVSYGDAMFGGNNWASDNAVLGRFGIYEHPDNFGGYVVVNQFASHPVTNGLQGISGEGVSIVEARGGLYPLQAPALCLANGSNCGQLPKPVPGSVFSALVCCDAGLGRVAATFDRNTFFNPPGLGTSIQDVSNTLYALNLFLWVAHYD